jgi:hypothetical protein
LVYLPCFTIILDDQNTPVKHSFVSSSVCVIESQQAPERRDGRQWHLSG